MTRKNTYVSPEAEQRVRQQELAERDSQEARDKKNRNFVQIEKRAFKELRGLIDRSAVAAKVLMILAEKMNRQNALVCSYDTLSKLTKLSRQTLYKAIKLLKEENWIQVLKVGNANAYVINSRVFWQSYGDRKYAVFNAVIVAGADEQETSAEDWDKVELRHFPFLSQKDEVVLSGENPDLPAQDEIDFHK
jgi:hypothetical protein